MQKWEDRMFLNQQLGMRVYIRIVMIMVLTFSVRASRIGQAFKFPWRTSVPF